MRAVEELRDAVVVGVQRPAPIAVGVRLGERGRPRTDRPVERQVAADGLQTEIEDPRDVLVRDVDDHVRGKLPPVLAEGPRPRAARATKGWPSRGRRSRPARRPGRSPAAAARAARDRSAPGGTSAARRRSPPGGRRRSAGPLRRAPRRPRPGPPPAAARACWPGRGARPRESGRPAWRTSRPARRGSGADGPPRCSRRNRAPGPSSVRARPPRRRSQEVPRPTAPARSGCRSSRASFPSGGRGRPRIPAGSPSRGVPRCGRRPAAPPLPPAPRACRRSGSTRPGPGGSGCARGTRGRASSRVRSSPELAVAGQGGVYAGERLAMGQTVRNPASRGSGAVHPVSGSRAVPAIIGRSILGALGTSACRTSSTSSGDATMVSRVARLGWQPISL